MLVTYLQFISIIQKNRPVFHEVDKRNDRNSSLLKIVSFVVVLSQTYVGLQYGVPHFLDT